MESVTQGRADPRPETDAADDDAERDAEEHEEWCGAREPVQDQAEDQSTHDGTDEKSTESEQVTAAQPR
jgi:hypothetical protein